MFNPFSLNEKYRELDQFTDYEKISLFEMKTRTITEQEYKSVPFIFKSKLQSLFTPSGILLVIFSILALCNLIYSVYLIITGQPDGWMTLFITSALSLFSISLTLLCYRDRLKQVITKNEQVTAGEVAEMIEDKGSKGTVLGAYHIVALHGSRKIVFVYNKKPFKKGRTVLVVIKSGTKPYLIPVPKEATDYDMNPGESDYRNEGAVPTEYDDCDRTVPTEFDNYERTDVRSVIRSITPEEYGEIPEKNRGVHPFKHGYVSVLWVIFTVAAIVMVVFLIKYFRERNAEMFFPLLVGFLCEMIIDLILCAIVFKKDVSQKDSCFLDCVIIKKYIVNGEHYIKAAIPETKQFIDHMKISGYQYENLSQNSHVSLCISRTTYEITHIFHC